MSDYQDGYKEGYEDGLRGNYSFTEKMEGFLGQIVDLALGVTEREE